MGSALTARLAQSGENIVVFDRDPDKAQVVATHSELATAGHDEEAAQQDIVILALWHDVARAFAADHRDLLAGRIVVDISNPLGDSLARLAVEPTTSAAEMLAAVIPDSRVVKAFNTTHPPVLLSGRVAGYPPDVFVASDDEDAKRQVIDVADMSGLQGVDAGPLEMARTLERMTGLSLHLATRYETGLESGFKYLTPRECPPPA